MKIFTFNVKATLCVVLFTIVNFCFGQNPGNVSTNLQLWLKANEGVATSGTQVTQWSDYSPNASTAVRDGSAQGPRLLDDGLNFNPTLAFDNGVTQYLKLTTASTPELNLDPINDKLTFFTVFVADDSDSEGVVFSKANGTYRNYAVWLGEVNRTVHYTGGAGPGSGNIGHHWGDETLDARYEPKISTGYVTDGTYQGSPRHVYKSFVNGVFDDFPAENPYSNTGNAGIGTGSYDCDVLIGARRSNSTNGGAGFLLHDAEIAEIIIYDKQLNTVEIAKVESYLAIKYGVTLGYNDSEASSYFGTSNDYILADGYTKAWDGSDNAGYGYAVFGIARDDQSGLEQLKSTSTNVQRIVSGGSTTILNSILVIESEASSIANNKSFLMVGHNGSNVAVQTSSMPERVLSTINRKWKSRESTNEVGTLKLEFDLSQYSLSNPEDYELIVSSNEDLTNYKNYEGSYNSTTKTISFTGVDLDDAEYFTLAKLEELDSTYQFEFNGTNRYVDLGDNFDLTGNFTISAWIKRDNVGNRSIISKINSTNTEGYNFRITTSGKLEMYWINGSSQSVISTSKVPAGKWHHIAAVYDGSLTLYIDGIMEKSASKLSPLSTSHSAVIGAYSETSPSRFYSGDIDELRIWNVALTEDQLHYIMFQEIENKSGFVAGSYFENRGITVTNNMVSSLSWSNLIGYFPFSHIKGNCLFNKSSFSTVNGRTYNTSNTSFETQTAPMPYRTTSNGDWDSSSTWANGGDQNIPGHTSLKFGSGQVDWSIVEISHNITMDNNDIASYDGHKNRSLLALFIDSNKLTLDGTNGSSGNGLTVTHYLSIDGEIDLNGESQLIQTENSDLVVGTSGKIEKDQQGTADTFTYNYWSSPVGITDLSENNYRYTVKDVMYDGTNPINFITSSYDGANTNPIGIADYWIWKYTNQTSGDYSSWQHVRSTGNIDAGEGFTMKGPGTGSISTEQNYVFKGKPNNGDIELDLNEDNDYLVGNPYPSAIDGEQFILDNGPTIAGSGNTTGTLYFWEHWGGGSHVLQEYQGGYATYNLSGGTPAASKADIDPNVDQEGITEGTKVPGRYIPVGQGFFVIGESTGKIKFNNGQRVFHKEGTGSSVFVRGNTNSSNSDTNGEDDRLKIRLGFTSIDVIHRQILLTVDERATVGYDWGFDGHLNDEQVDDLSWIIDDEKYVIQGIDDINTYNTSLPVALKKTDVGDIIISIEELENVPDDLDIYLHDLELEIFHDLRHSDYEVNLPAGQYDNRYEIVFNSPNSLSTIDEELNELSFYYAMSRNKVVVLNPNNLELKSIELYNIAGQSVYKNDKLWEGSYNEYEIQNLSTGAYIVKLNTENNNTITKKIIIK